MLAELLILSALREREYTIYKIGKTIDRRFSLFCRTGLSVIHRALKGLSGSGYVKLRKSMSKGGQKSSRYSITQDGRRYFEELMTAGLPANPILAGQLVNVRILLLNELENPARSRAIGVLKDYCRGVLTDFEDFIGDDESAGPNRDYLKVEISAIEEKIRFLGFMEQG